MGKTHKGTIWLDPELTSPFEYYQYWINQDDKDIERFLSLFTFLPMDEVRKLGSLSGADIRQAKEVLAYEATQHCHGKKEAEKARSASRELFGVKKTGFITIQIAGTTTNAPSKQAKIDITTKNPKN